MKSLFAKKIQDKSSPKAIDHNICPVFGLSLQELLDKEALLYSQGLGPKNAFTFVPLAIQSFVNYLNNEEGKKDIFISKHSPSQLQPLSHFKHLLI